VSYKTSSRGAVWDIAGKVEWNYLSSAIFSKGLSKDYLVFGIFSIWRMFFQLLRTYLVTAATSDDAPGVLLAKARKPTPSELVD
jgi:hypothetical protein